MGIQEKKIVDYLLIRATIRMGREILCLPYVVYFKIVLQNLQEVTRMVIQSDLWLWLLLLLIGPLWKNLFGAARPTLFESQGRLFHIVLVDYKSQRASKLHYWFKSNDVFAWICWAESNDYSAHRHCGNCNLTFKIPKSSTRLPQNPNKAIEPICSKCHTQEVLKRYFKVLILREIDILTYWHIHINI